jgi:hypothetical protein
MIPITNTKGLYLCPVSNTTPSRLRLQYLLPKTYNMTSCRFHIHHQPVSLFIFSPRHHALPNVSAFNRGTTLLPNDDALPTADASYRMRWRRPPAERYSLPNSTHMSAFSCTNFCCYHMPLQLWDKSDFIPESTINTRHPQAESVQHPFFSPSNRWSARPDPNPSSSTSPSLNPQMANHDQALQVNLILFKRIRYYLSRIQSWIYRSAPFRSW